MSALSSERHVWRECDKLPKWRRWLVCFSRPNKWRVAVAANITAVAAFRAGEHELFDELVRFSDEKWAEVFDITKREAAP